MSFVNYLNQFATAVEAQDGKSLAIMLSMSNPQLASTAHFKESKVSQYVPNPWNTFIVLLQNSITQFYNNSIIEALNHHNSLVQSFQALFCQLGKWSLPILYTLLNDLRSLSIMADVYLAQNNLKTGKLEEACRTFNKSFSYCVTDRFSPIETTRKWGTYAISNLIFKTYIKLGSTNLSNTMLRSIQAAELPPLDLYPLSDQTTFKYYTGVFAFLNENYEKAEEDLLFAFSKCGLHSPRKNMILILNYLIPIRMLSGILPSARLFAIYPELSVYNDIRNAILYGNLKLFDSTLNKHQKDLITKGTYLTVEKLRNRVIRSLFKKIWLIKNKDSRMSFNLILRGLQVSSMNAEIEMEEAECFLACQIDFGFMKGYLSHEKQTVVLSKKADPFPKKSL